VKEIKSRGALLSLLTKYYSGDKIKKNEVGRACSTYVAGEKCIQDFGVEI
jgi:hypothetical protein